MQVRAGFAFALTFTACLLLTGVLSGPVSAGVLATSTFDSGTEGWTAVTLDTAGNIFPGSVSFAAGAGNRGGALQHLAPSEGRTSYFSAPGFIVGALHAAQGGFVSWDISTINQRYTLGFATAAGWLFVDGSTMRPASQAEIDAVISGADTLLIRAEYWSSATNDASLLDNVVIAGSGPAVILNRTTAAPGEPVELRLVSNSALGAVDLYVVVALPPAIAPSLGCGGGLALVFVTDGGTALTLACDSNPPSTFPRYTGNSALPQSAPLLSIPWPGEAPPGPYIFAAVVTPPGALADGVIGPADLLAVAGVPLTGL